MLTYGGIGLFLGGIILALFGDKIIKDPEKAANAKKQGPILSVVGIGFLGLAYYLGAFG